MKSLTLQTEVDTDNTQSASIAGTQIPLTYKKRLITQKVYGFQAHTCPNLTERGT